MSTTLSMSDVELKMAQSNIGMHPTRDTQVVIYNQRGLRAGDAGRSASS